MSCNCFFGGERVGSKGNIQSPLVVVAESPSIKEIIEGKPFAGPPGELLKGMMDKFSFPIPFVTNAVQCLPKNKTPQRLAKACQACNCRLLTEVKAHPRKLIIAVGAGALWSLTGNYNLKITQVRGQIFKSDLAEYGILAVTHPSFLLRGGGSVQQFESDFKLAAEILGTLKETNTEGSYKAFKPCEHEMVNKSHLVTALAKDFKRIKFIGADIETDGFDPLLGNDNRTEFYKSSILCAGFSIAEDKSYVIPGHLITDDLFDNSASYCWHNGKFDIKWLRYKGFNKAKVDDDTMLMSYAMNEKGGLHDLEQVGSDWLRAPNYKNMLEGHLKSKKESYATVPPDILHLYQGIDANLTYCLGIRLLEELRKDEKLYQMYRKVLVKASEFLWRVERNGFFVDQIMVDYNSDRLERECEEHEAYFINMAGREINVRSWQQLQAYLWDELKLAPSGTGTAKEIIERVYEKKPHKALRTLINYRRAAKKLSTYVKSAKERSRMDGRVHPTFKIHGTTTGRLSCAQPNIQNIPRDPLIRGQYMASPGNCLLECDLSQAELRVLAVLSNDPILMDIFLTGKSLHDEVATYLFGENFTKDQKVVAKNINFGIIYGVTPFGLKEQLEDNARLHGSKLHFSLADCAKWIKDWAERFPVAWQFIMRCRDVPLKRGSLRTPFGRKRRFLVTSRERMNDLQNEAANFPEQSCASDITLLSGISLIEGLETDFNCKIVNTVHDCLVSDLPDKMEIILEASIRIIDRMQEVPKEWGLTEIPFEAEAEIGYRWGNLEKFNPFTIKEKGDYHGKTVQEYFGIERNFNTKLLESA